MLAQKEASSKSIGSILGSGSAGASSVAAADGSFRSSGIFQQSLIKTEREKKLEEQV